ncbi:MAG: CapA family protein [Phycisphaerae bacterium]|nr:CapA family protein [Phycisphaerae bacterium]
MSTIRIACLGDIMCGDSFYNAGSGVASSLAHYGRDFLRPDIVDYLRGHDLVMGNVECVLSDKGRNNRRLRSIQMRGSGRTADLLADWNLTVANVANNHILEHGHAAARDTVDNLLRSGIRVIGSGGANTFHKGLRIEQVCRQGLKMAFIGMCLRREKYAFNGGAELDQVIEAVEALNKTNVFVCVSMHWGNEFMDYPSPEQTRIADALIRAGARMIIGHHPHVVQGVESRNGALVAYSLGNFIFDSFLADCRWSVMLSVDISDGEVAGWRCVPVLKDHEHRPVLVGDPGKAELTKEFLRRCTLLKASLCEEVDEQRYLAAYRSRDARARRSLHGHLCRRLVHMEKIYWPQILFRPIQRRLGLW